MQWEAVTVKAWCSRASSHSAYYTVVANFKSRREASEVLARLPDILSEHSEEMRLSGYDGGSHAVVSGTTLSFCGHYDGQSRPSFLKEALEEEGARWARIDDAKPFQVLRFLIPIPKGTRSRGARLLLGTLAIIDEGYGFILKHSRRLRLASVRGRPYIEATYVGEDIYDEWGGRFWQRPELNALLGRVKVGTPQEVVFDDEEGFRWRRSSEA
jgi:ribulose bisphosphate carboxylase small subunit